MLETSQLTLDQFAGFYSEFREIEFRYPKKTVLLKNFLLKTAHWEMSPEINYYIQKL